MKCTSCWSRVSSTGKLIFLMLRLPNGTQMSDGVNRKRLDVDATVTSTASPSSCFSASAAVSPAKLLPRTRTDVVVIVITSHLQARSTPRRALGQGDHDRVTKVRSEKEAR